MKEIKINKIIFEPHWYSGQEIDICGEKYRQLVKDPNLFVIDCDLSDITDSNLQFEYNDLLYKLYGTYIFKKNNLFFIECRSWEICVIEELSAKQMINKYKISRKTLSNWVKSKKINTKKTNTGRYIYIDPHFKLNEKV